METTRRTFRFGIAALAAAVTAGSHRMEAQADVPGAWGERPGYTIVAGQDLVPSYEGLDLRPDWDLIGVYAPTGGVYCSDTTDDNGFANAVARLDLPEGAALDTAHWWSYDASSELDLFYTIWQICQAPGDLSPIAMALGEGFTIGSAGNQYWSSNLHGHTVNNRSCLYILEVRFGTGNGCPAHDALVVRKVGIQWHRQVSPAPSSASFLDVPTGHAFFPFVEALKKSGITGGCALEPPRFCPDQPVTRGQMAAFLAKALGLQWP